MLTPAGVSELVQRELAKIGDSALAERIRCLLVEPYPVDREWDYGARNEMITCWTVMEPWAFCARAASR